MDRSELPPRTNPPRRPAWRALVRWALALVLVLLLVELVRADPAPLLAVLEMRPELLLGFVLLVLVNQLLMSWRLGSTVERCGGHKLPRRTWFRLTSVGQFLNLFVPQLGNLYRAVVLKHEHHVPYFAYASGLLAFVWLDLVTGLSIAGLVIAVSEPGLALAGLNALLLLAVVLALVALAPAACVRLVRALRLERPLAARIAERAARLFETLSGVLREPRFLARFLAINLLVTATHVATLGLGFHVVGSAPGLGVLVLFQVVVKLANQVAITPGNLGLTELAYGILAQASGLTLEQGIAVALLLRAVGTLAVIILGVLSGGAPWLFGRRRRLELERAQVGSGGDAALDFSATRK